MLNVIVKHIKTKIAQHTHLFDTESQDVVANTQNNVISITGLEGEYTLSGGELGIASTGCMNDTHLFGNGQVVTDCFFGDTLTAHNVQARKLNVGHAFKRNVALEAIIDTKSGNSIIVYTESARATSDQYPDTESVDLNFKAAYTIGVMFKVDAKQIQELGCTDYDKLFINSVIGARKAGTTLVKFVSVIDRFYAGESYVVDIEFSYVDEMFMEDSFLNGLKHFDATLGDLNI
jgi:hypothetical protein